MFSPFLTIDSSCDEAAQVTKKQLSQAGLWSVQTFNLNTARFGLHHCTCPSHGTEACDCQMIVLLVYREEAEPVTLILHGNDGQTWLSIAESPDHKPDTTLSTKIKQTLEKVSGSISRVE